MPIREIVKATEARSTGVDNVAALRLVPGGYRTGIIETLGRTTINDGSGGLYYWDASATAIDDDHLVIRPSDNPVSGRWLKRQSLASGAAGGVLSGTYPNPNFAADMATQAELDAHVNDTDDAHDASAISLLDSGGNYVSTNVEAALAEEADARQAHESDTTGAHAASAISYGGGTGTGSSNVEDALDELSTEKQDTTTNYRYETVYWIFDGTLSTTPIVGKFKVPVVRSGTIEKAWAIAGTAPTGQAAIFDINYNGTSIWANGVNRVTIPISSTSMNVSSTITNATVAEDGYLTCDVDQRGSTAFGADIVVALRYRYTI